MDIPIAFVSGMFVMLIVERLLQSFGAYHIYKRAELYAIMLILESEVWRRQALKVLEIVYDYGDKQEEYQKIVESINKRFDEAQQNTIALIKKRVPYDIKYNTLAESEQYVIEDLKKLDGE